MPQAWRRLLKMDSYQWTPFLKCRGCLYNFILSLHQGRLINVRIKSNFDILAAEVLQKLIYTCSPGPVDLNYALFLVFLNAGWLLLVSLLSSLADKRQQV